MYEYSKLKYNQYVDSISWKKIRNEVLERDKRKCVICGSNNNLKVHHILYTLLNEQSIDTDISFLITLCECCHNKIHQNINNKFRR